MFLIENIKEFAKNPDRIAAVDTDGIELSYKQLDERSEALASFLIENYPGKSPVIIWCDKENDTLSLILACVKSAHPYVPVASNYPAKKVEQIVKECQASVALTVGKIPFPKIDYSIELFEKEKIEQIFIQYANRKVDPSNWARGENVFSYFFTSGSTGKPKGVATKAKNIEAYKSYFKSLYEEAKADSKNAYRYLNIAPYAFSFSVGYICGAMGCYGHTLYAVDRDLLKDNEGLIKYILNVQPGHISCTPSLMKMLIRRSSFCTEKLPSFAMLDLAGEPVTKDLLLRIKEKFPNIQPHIAMGATETTASPMSCVITDELLRKLDDVVPVGDCSRNSNFKIIKEDNTIAEEGELGELIIESPLVVDGYFNDEESTKRFFYQTENGTMGFHTNDMVQSIDGYVYFRGRKNNMIKVGGYRIELEDVEKTLMSVGTIASAAVIPAIKEENALWLDAYIVLSENSEANVLTTINIKKQLSTMIQPYMIPQRIFYVEELPTNDNGKLDRQLLIEKSKIRD